VNLELEGLAVDVATDGRECLAMARANPPDLITLDLVMPSLDGLYTAAKLRSDARTRHIPLVLLTGAATPRDRVRADEIGIEVFLAKPFQPADLVAAVRGLLERPRPAGERTESPVRTPELHG
jgi:DNA-binding response OmpR family regulator